MHSSDRSQTAVFAILLAMMATIALSPVRVEAAASVTRRMIANGAIGSSTTAGAQAGKVIRSTLGQSVVGSLLSTPTHSLTAGFWPGTPTPVVGIAEAAPAPIEHYRLYSAVPNPFNPRTAIAFDVPAPGGRVRLAIHDVRGRLVKALVSGESLPGHQVIAWDGTDDEGHGVSSGIFICSLEAGGNRMTQKLVLLR
jgi:hypothetical protein